MSDIAALLERVRAATGPDRAIDRDIEEHIVGTQFRSTKRGREWLTDSHGGVETWSRQATPFTASVDAALALVERQAGHRWYGVLLDAVRDLGVSGTSGPEHLPRFIIVHFLQHIAGDCS